MEQSNLISRLRHYLSLVLISFVGISLIINCTEKPLEIDPGNILPDDDMLNVIFKDIPVELYTVSLEALETQSIGISPLGVVNDPVMGTLETDFISDFVYNDDISFINGLPDSFEILDLTIDLAYAIHYGNPYELNFNVYELTEPIPIYTKSDYIMYPHMYNSEPLNDGHAYSERKYLLNTQRDTLSIYSIRLKNDFAERLIDEDLLDSGIYNSSSVDLFRHFFTGLYFAVEPRVEEGGTIITVDHRNSSMLFRIRGWNSTSESWDTINNTYSIGNSQVHNGVHLNMYRNIPSNQLEEVINDTITPQSSVYIQSLSGTKIYVKMPSLAAIRDTLDTLVAISVNRAQLILPINEEIYNRDKQLYSPPARLGIFDSKSNYALYDNYAENHIDGYLDFDNYQYVLNIEEHIHEYLRNDTNSFSNTFYVFAGSGTPVIPLVYTPARIVLNGSEADRKPYVRLIYSEIPK